MRLNDISEAIGKTPVVRLSRMFPNHKVWMKLERVNPAGSIKDRVAKYLIENAERRGILKKGDTILEATSGNTGIALAMIGAIKGYKVVLVMSKKMSAERVSVMKAFGAEVVFTPAKQGTLGAYKKAQKLLLEIPNAWMPNQFSNQDCIASHIESTAQEIRDDFPQGLDYIVSASGTGAHISGLAIELKRHSSKLRVYAIEPSISPVLAGGKARSHKITGTSPGFVPQNFKREYIDGVIHVSEEDAFRFASILAKREGILGGVSTGAALSGLVKFMKSKDVDPSKEILTFNYDLGERYLSLPEMFS